MPRKLGNIHLVLIRLQPMRRHRNNTLSFVLGGNWGLDGKEFWTIEPSGENTN